MSETTPTTFTPQPSPSADNPYPNSTPPLPHQPEAKYNLFSLISFISAFYMSVLAVVMGHMALSEIKKTGERGRGLALAGLILGYLGTLLGLGFIVVMIVAAAAASPTSEFSVFDSKAQSGFTQTEPDETKTEPLATDLPPAQTTVSAQFCDVLATMNANASDGTAAEQTPDELLGSYKRLGEVASPNQAVYAEFYEFVAGSERTTPSSADTSAIMDKVQVASVSDAHACAELGGGN